MARGEKNKKDFSDIPELLSRLGLVVESVPTYVNGHTKFQATCPIHGTFQTSCKRIRTGYGCRKCSFKKLGDSKKLSLNETTERLQRIGLSVSPGFVYLNNKSPIEAICPVHGSVTISPSTISRFIKAGFKGCSTCSRTKNSYRGDLTLDEIKQASKSIRAEAVEVDWKQRRVHLNCPVHGLFFKRPYDLLKGSGCPKCSHHVSKPESDIASFISDLIGPEKVSTSNRSIVPPKELDIFIPSHNLAIEYCGEYWHSEQKKGRLAHYDKWKACDQKNVQLITIFENSFKDRKDQYLQYIESKLQLSKLIVGARKCQVEEIDAKLAKPFIEKYHIQGFSRSSFCVALKLEGELVGIMSFAPHHRQANADIVVLNRLCFKSGVTIQGGASKMLKFAIPLLKAKGYISIITWSDNCLSNGNVYEKMGFKLDKELPPDYFYSSGKQSRSKQNSTKKALLKMGATGTTELEMAQSLGYERIWDCGKKRWALNL